jgi:hypothetical protein
VKKHSLFFYIHIIRVTDFGNLISIGKNANFNGNDNFNDSNLNGNDNGNDIDNGNDNRLMVMEMISV